MKRKVAILNITNSQRKLQFLKYRYMPYFIIIVFSFAATIARVLIISEWGILIHSLLLVLQAAMLSFIWVLVKSLNNFLDKRIPFSTGPITRIALQIALTLLILSPLFATVFYIARHVVPPPFVTAQFMAIALALMVVMIFLFNFAFYAYYFFGNWQQSIEDKAALEVQAAELEKEKLNLQYHQLRNQVNPHYLFNTLSSLDGLIHTNPELASEFVRHMAKVYRYVLQHKESEVVNLDEELEFIQHYTELLHIRYAVGLQITYKISAPARDRGIIMVTLQMLIDNAIKHNIVQAGSPLKVAVRDEEGYIVVNNNKQLRKQIETSNGQGLKQLKQLYAFHTDKSIIIEDTEDCYTIKIPLL